MSYGNAPAANTEFYKDRLSQSRKTDFHAGRATVADVQLISTASWIYHLIDDSIY